jgi:hypothetical protein
MLLALLASCSNSTPTIAQVFSQVNDVFTPPEGPWQPRLSVFVQVTNADGPQELATVDVVNDEDRLLVALNSTNWTKIERPGEVWLGTNNLAFPDGSNATGPVPTGQWRVVVQTKAGLQSEASFAIPPLAPLTIQKSRARVSLERPTDSKGVYRLRGFASDVVIWALAANGDLVAQKKTTSSEFTLDSLAPGAAALTTSLLFYSYDKTAGHGLEAGPFPVK